MIKLQQLLDDGYEFFTGVPDSGLKPLINEIIEISEVMQTQTKFQLKDTINLFFI